MRKLPNKFVLSIKPEEYLKQGISHCGAYSVKAILSALGKDTKNHPREYHPTLIGKITGATMSRQYWVNVLRSHGVKAEAKTAEELTDTEKLEVLKRILANNKPVMIAIANAYDSQGKYIPIRRFLWDTGLLYGDMMTACKLFMYMIPVFLRKDTINQLKLEIQKELINKYYEIGKGLCYQWQF